MSKQLKEKIMKYGELTLGQVEALVNKLGGMEGVKRFLSGELLVSATAKVWKTWKTIKLGNGLQTADDFRKAVKSAGMKIDDWANDILGKPAFTATTSKTEVELVVASVAELGFKDGATRKDIYVRAQEFGLDLCPPEVGPYLRLQYTDQPKGEWLIIAMEPITDLDGNLSLFFVTHDGGERWLSAVNGYPHSFWSGYHRFVFLRRK
ncbi:MAG: hypothetical protein RLZZ308_710 [Candidatus Parcubacteria bacterium]|jgi:hypothetical protein